MDVYTLSDKAISDEIGARFRGLRLEKNVTQKDLAEATDLSLNSIKALEQGKAKLSTMITVLRHLGALHNLEQFVSTTPISPLTLVNAPGHDRQRATGEHGKHKTDGDFD